jgi:hypothetical protein
MAAYLRTLDEKLLEFERVGHQFREKTTGSLFTVEGLAIDGPLAGRRSPRSISLRCAGAPGPDSTQPPGCTGLMPI